jgi:hypothetical protein
MKHVTGFVERLGLFKNVILVHDDCVGSQNERGGVLPGDGRRFSVSEHAGRFVRGVGILQLFVGRADVNMKASIYLFKQRPTTRGLRR